MAGTTSEPASEPGIDEYSAVVDLWNARENPVRFQRGAPGWIELRWPAAPAAPVVRYLVVEGADQIAQTPDGGRRALVTDEPLAAVGVDDGPWFTVFAYAADDVAALRTTPPVLHAAGRQVPEVDRLRVQAHPDSVMLTWRLPAGVDRVRVVRSAPDQELPAGFDAALELPAGADHLNDTEVQPGRRYRYRVVTEFVDRLTGDRTLSSGLEQAATVPATPVPVTDLRASLASPLPMARVDLSWPTQALGDVVVYEAAEVPSHAATGKVISQEQFGLLRLGEPVPLPPLSGDGTTTIPRVPFDERRGAQRAYTPVTTIGDQVAVGVPVVLTVLGQVSEVSLVERVDWQLLRFAWPAGATYVEVHRGPVGGEADGAQPQQILREEYQRQGGMRLNLPLTELDLLIRGSRLYRNEWSYGEFTRVHYPGRLVLRYRFEKQGWFGSGRVLQLQVERDWPEFRIALIRGADRLPLRFTDTREHPVLTQAVPAGLPPGEWFPVAEVNVPDLERVRLFAELLHDGSTPIVVDPPTWVRGGARPRPPMTPGHVRCVRCGSTQMAQPQVFRCVGGCAPVLDPVRSQALAQSVSLPPAFVVGPAGPPGQAAPVPTFRSAPCPNCHTTSETQLCRDCHGELPPDADRLDPVSLAVVGARGTGKTTYLVSLLNHLRQVWGRTTGATVTELDATTRARVAELMENVEQGFSVGSTVAAGAKADILEPLLLGLDQHGGRRRTLSLFDAAGEDLEEASRVRAYGANLARADAIAFLFDPLQDRSVRAQTEGLIHQPPIAGDPLLVLNNVVDEVQRRLGTERIPTTLAVVVSKLDALQLAARSPGTPLSGLLNGGSTLMSELSPTRGIAFDPADRGLVHEETRSLLLHLGATQFVARAESSFATVEYFAVSALGHGPVDGAHFSDAGITSFRVADPLLWLLQQRWPVQTGR